MLLWSDAHSKTRTSTKKINTNKIAIEDTKADKSIWTTCSLLNYRIFWRHVQVQAENKLTILQILKSFFFHTAKQRNNTKKLTNTRMAPLDKHTKERRTNNVKVMFANNSNKFLAFQLKLTATLWCCSYSDLRSAAWWLFIKTRTKMDLNLNKTTKTINPPGRDVQSRALKQSGTGTFPTKLSVS